MNFLKTTALVCALSVLSSIHGQNAALQQTVIDSDRMELQSKPDRNVFRFIGNVVISGTNLKARCDEMELISLRAVSADTAEADEGLIGQIGGIESLIAKGNVYLEQEGRVVEGQLAKIFPKEGYLEITGDPKFRDSSGAVVTGKTIKLERGKRQATVEPYEDGTQVRVTLPPMEDLGVDLDSFSGDDSKATEADANE